MNPSIRPIDSNDVEAIAAIHAASWRNTYRGMLSDAFLDGEILANRRALWTERLVPLPTMSFGFIANLERLSVGFCFGFGAADAKWGTMLDNIHVLPEYKSRGIGRLLLAKFASEAATRDANAGLFLWAYEDNTATRKFYERLGASPVERAVDEAPGGGRIAEWRYAWESPGALLAALP